MKRDSSAPSAISRIFFLACFLSLALVLAACTEKAKEPVKLVFTSWRGDDWGATDKLNAVFSAKYPHITVRFEIVPRGTEYDDELLASLEAGVGADIMFLRAYENSQSLYDKGYLLKINDIITGLEKYPGVALNAWKTDTGDVYAVPAFGVSHGIFYNKEIFARYNLSPPKTWDQFLNLCTILKNNGETVIAQGTQEEWPLYEVVFSGLGPNFFGGEKNRQKLIKGELKLTDEPFVRVFRELKKLQPFFPEGYRALDYAAMRQMFGSEKAALYIGGSWELFTFEQMGIMDKIGWFPPPVLKSTDRLQYCIHVDAGIGINKSSRHMEEALAYLKWAATPEYAQLLMDLNLGYFSYTQAEGEYKLDNKLAKKMIDTAKNADVTVRTVWEKLSAGEPDGNTLLGEAMAGLYSGLYTPEQAAAYVQNNLAAWYEPFQEK